MDWKVCRWFDAIENSWATMNKGLHSTPKYCSWFCAPLFLVLWWWWNTLLPIWLWNEYKCGANDERDIIFVHILPRFFTILFQYISKMWTLLTVSHIYVLTPPPWLIEVNQCELFTVNSELWAKHGVGRRGHRAARQTEKIYLKNMFEWWCLLWLNLENQGTLPQQLLTML